MTEQEMVVTSSPKKKIGFFSAILIVMGSAIGVGIFLRSKSVISNAAGNIALALVVWLIAGFAVVTMALALVEVASGRNDNLGLIGWTKAFNTLYIYKGTKFFMTYLYLPFTYFFMPYYVIVQFQDGVSGFGGNINFGGTKAAPWIYFAIGLIITVWFIFTAGLNSRSGNIQNWIFTIAKMIPIVAIVIIGLAYAVKNGKADPSSLWTPITKASLYDKTSTSFLGLSPFLGIFASMGGIFFAFDGFYVTAGIQSEMKQPEKTPAALVIGLLSMTVIYMIIAASMTLGNPKGGFYEYGEMLAADKYGWVFGIMNILIAIGILGILNGFTMWATRWVEDLIKEGEMYVPAYAYRYVKHAKTPIVGALFCLILSLPFMLLFTGIGAYGYFDTWGVDAETADKSYYGWKIGALLSFSDLMANWMAVFAFAFIIASIIGSLINRKKHFIAVTENKHTKWAGITASVLVLLPLFFLMIDPIVSIGMNAVNYTADKHDTLVGNIAATGLLIFYLIVMFLSTPIERHIAKCKKIKLEKILRGDMCICDRAEYCPCEMVLVKEAYELNELVLKTYREARV